MDHAKLHARARERGVNPLVYWITRGILQPFFHLYFRLSRIGREHIPTDGPVILAANHRSFLDPFVIGTCLRRPIYYVAKKELFLNRVQGWFLNALGAFPVDRGAGDRDTIDTAKAILARGDCVLIFPEGTRTRPGSLGRAKRGVGRLALESGAPVVPVAVIGTEAIRNGWRFRPHKVRIRAGAPLTFPKVEKPSSALAGAVTDRIWPRVNDRYLPAVPLPDKVAVHRAADLELAHHDLVCLAVPARDLPSVVAAHGSKIPARAGVLVLSKGLVPPLGTLPTAYVAERTEARAVACLGGPGDAADALAHGASLVAACADQGFLKQLGDVFAAARFDLQRTTDVTGVELAGAARHAAILAASAAAASGPNAAGAAAGKVLAEVDAYSRRHGGQPGTFAGLAGAGDLVASIFADTPGERVTAEALDALPLLAAALREDGAEAPAVTGLADVVAGRVEPERWAAAVMKPTRTRAA